MLCATLSHFGFSSSSRWSVHIFHHSNGIYSNWKSCIECHFNWPFVTIRNTAREYIFIYTYLYMVTVCQLAQPSHSQFCHQLKYRIVFFFNVDSFFMSSRVININFICRCWLLYERWGRERRIQIEQLYSIPRLDSSGSASDGCWGFACEINWDSPVDLAAMSDSKSQRGKQIKSTLLSCWRKPSCCIPIILHHHPGHHHHHHLSATSLTSKCATTWVRQNVKKRV